MDQGEFILKNLEIDKNKFGRIFSFVDFGNVNYWYAKDRAAFAGKILTDRERIAVGIEKLGCFIDLFSEKKFFYYGIDSSNRASIHLQVLAEKRARFKTSSKFIQNIKHYLTDKQMGELRQEVLRLLPEDEKGMYLEIQKCNFDVELTIDTLRLTENFDTCALFSSDSDFTALLKYLKLKGKKIILFHSGPTLSLLKSFADLKINAQRIREVIGFVK